MQGTRPQAVIFGAGNVGRGFLGQLFCESGYEVVFVDIDRTILEGLNQQRGYRLSLVDNDGSQDLWITPVRALCVGDKEEVARAVAGSAILTTAVGVRALPAVAHTIARGILQRLADPAAPPLNVIVCENLKDAAATLRSLVEAEMPEGERSRMAGRMGFVDTVIGRMVPLLTDEQRAQDPTSIMAEPYQELPVDGQAWIGPVPAVKGLQACDHFAIYVARKLYIHNGGHAVLAYLGYQRQHTYGYEALADPAILPWLQAAWCEIQAGIAAVHGASPAWLQAHADDLQRRFANRALGDTILRLARDPLRKLAPDDRLVGAARLVQAAGLTPEALSWAIAAGYHFDSPEDPIAGKLQEQIAAQGLPATMQAVSGISADEPLGQAVLTCYRRLQSGEWPRSTV